MRYVRNSDQPNTVVGIFILLLLAMIGGPRFFPQAIAAMFPGFDEGVPCGWLRAADDRANHQSLLGRAAAAPIQLRVRASAITNVPSEFLIINIAVTNNSLGSVPILYDPNQVIVGDNNTSGLGVIFNPPTRGVVLGARGGDPAVYPEANLRILGPRQTCIHQVQIPNGNVLIDPALNTGTGQVRAYYRVNAPGQVTQTNALATPIYPDQGLWVGYVESETVQIPLGAVAQ